ncbi:MAG: threonine/serine exporter family protein [Niameybacter sp.]|uniref:threonine/serine exporter family protein n=1 Tax=Niameybacter sp. TaxID=2033640 RepID=UPI002FCB0BAC
MSTLIIHVVSAFFATIFFSILFNVQHKHLIACGIIGAIGWGIYTLGVLGGYSDVLFTFLGAYFVAQGSYFLAKYKRAPVTVFLIPGIIPLVPGIGLYRTMYALLFSDHTKALEYALTTFQLSGVIAGAIIMAALLPILFRPHRQKL